MVLVDRIKMLKRSEKNLLNVSKNIKKTWHRAVLRLCHFVQDVRKPIEIATVVAYVLSLFETEPVY